MNRIIRLSCFFILSILIESEIYGQNWNLTTVCKKDFGHTTGQAIQIFPLANDINQNGQALSLKSISYSEHGRAVLNGESIQFIPFPDFHGLGHVLYTACDNKGNCGIGEISVVITDPANINYTDTISEGVLRNTTFTFYIPEPDFQLSAAPKYGQVSKVSDYEYHYQPTGPAGSSEQLIFQKGNNKTVFQLTLVDQPVKNQYLVDDIIYLNKNTSRLFSLTKNDINTGGSIVVKSISQPTSGSVSLNADNTLTYSSAFDFEGITQFEYTACNQVGCETAKAYLYVSDFLPREDLNPIFRVAEGRSVVIPYDVPVQDYEFKILNQPSFGVLDFYKGNNSINLQCESQNVFNPLVYSPFPGFIGNDQFIVNFCLTTGTKQCAPIKIKIETYSESGCLPSSEFVWPGDANNDGIVTLKDVNTISKLVGTIGEIRKVNSTSWQNQISKDWTRAEGINAKHADANGDGVIDRDDIKVVMDNALQAHKLVPQGIYQLIPTGSSASPVAKVIAPGDDAVIQLEFGDKQNLLSDVEAISFDLEYNDQLIKPEDIEVGVIENSWFGYDNAILQGRFIGKGKLSYTLSSARSKSRYGFGRTIRIVTKGGPITGHIEGFKIPKELPIEFKIKNIQIASPDGATTLLPDTKATVIIDFNKKSTAPGIVQYPNPASDFINITVNNSKDLIEQISITDISGKTIISRNLVPVKHYQQTLSQLQQGVYVLRIKTNSGLFTQKVEVIH
ncbi:MAG: Ig-like domain-containing protein [Saprospiraceae bacterium]